MDYKKLIPVSKKDRGYLEKKPWIIPDMMPKG